MQDHCVVKVLGKKDFQLLSSKHPWVGPRCNEDRGQGVFIAASHCPDGVSS